MNSTIAEAYTFVIKMTGINIETILIYKLQAERLSDGGTNRDHKFANLQYVFEPIEIEVTHHHNQ